MCAVSAGVEQVSEREQHDLVVGHGIGNHDPVLGHVVDDPADLFTADTMVRIDRDSLLDKVKG